MEKNNSTEALIMEAARNVFLRKGFAAARMQEIADEAGINKALLHYYFRSKDKLFDAIFINTIKSMMAKMALIINHPEMDLFAKIPVFVEGYMDFAMRNPFLLPFIVHELNQHPEKIIGKVLAVPQEQRPNPAVFIQQVEQAIAAGRIRKVAPAHLLISLVSMVIMPFIAKPMIQVLFQLDDEQFQLMLQQRKKEVCELILFSIRP